MIKTRPRFSIIIPTRERAQTLYHTLVGCLRQEYDDYEIVVCDNASSSATLDVIERLSSPRIVYHRSPDLLCMADNFNLAFSVSTGEYVLFIGDDDGVMPYAFAQVDALIRETGSKAVTWNTGVYSWPNILRDELANYIAVCASRKRTYFDGRQLIRDVMSGVSPPSFLPNAYHSVIARDVLDGIQSQAGQIFKGHGPDTYTSFSIAYAIDTFVRVETPMTISGFSSASSNVSFSLMNGKNANSAGALALNASFGITLHPLLPNLNLPWIIIADSYLQARQDQFPDDPTMTFDRRFLVERLLERLPIDTLDEWPAAIDLIRQSLQDDEKLSTWFEWRITEEEPRVHPRPSFVSASRGLVDNYFCLDATRFRVSNIDEAVRFGSELLDVSTTPIVWSDTSEIPTVEADAKRIRLVALESNVGTLDQLVLDGRSVHPRPHRYLRLLKEWLHLC